MKGRGFSRAGRPLTPSCYPCHSERSEESGFGCHPERSEGFLPKCLRCHPERSEESLPAPEMFSVSSRAQAVTRWQPRAPALGQVARRTECRTHGPTRPAAQRRLDLPQHEVLGTKRKENLSPLQRAIGFCRPYGTLPLGARRTRHLRAGLRTSVPPGLERGKVGSTPPSCHSE